MCLRDSTKVKVTLGIMFGVLVACLVVRLAVPSLQENQILNLSLIHI